VAVGRFPDHSGVLTASAELVVSTAAVDTVVDFEAAGLA